ncbi:MAG TPA: ATP-dependent RecD-like DNA helicase [Candidatus Pygmaiobacter gallistercoris]|nr:ATP-dependent RecD-like DNA helicase [Candidatus Pygmaiobacter gallistercoris]
MEKISGSVEHITFSNGDNGFAVIELSADGELLTAVGTMPGVAEGEEVELEGEFVNHPSFGPQFQVSGFSCRMPQDAAAVLRYLASGALPGIGPILARRIVDEFGADTLSVLESTPELLCRVRGMTEAKARAAAEEFRRVFGVREAIAALAQLGIPASGAISLYRALGPGTMDRIYENPYLLCDPPVQLPFEQVDEIAARLNFEQQARIRLRAGLGYILRHNSGNGHCCLPAFKLLPTAQRFLGVDEQSLREALDAGLEEGEFANLVCQKVEYIYLPELFRAEMTVAGHLKSLMALPLEQAKDPGREVDALERGGGIQYAAAQREAICTALTSNCMVLTGGPGTGKTTTVNAIITLFERRADRVLLAAPTGRAAKRMSELCGREAKTIHRMLEVDYGTDEQIRFIHNEKNPLKCDVVIIDEMSMVDLPLFESLLRALRPQCRIILVGDADQLPSVGPGNLLRDIAASGAVPVVRLTEIFRQAARSQIVRTAHRIVLGQEPEQNQRDGDCFFLPARGQECQDLICDLVVNRLPKSYGLDPVEEIQILCPSKLGTAGTQALNARLQALLNPPAPGKKQLTYFGVTYREGDKVMQVRNNYDLLYERENGDGGVGAFNGDLGIIEAVDPRSGSLKVRSDDRLYTYTGETLRELEIAYAVTVHKSQGSEFRAVVLPVAEDTPRRLCYRNLIYTGVTRARQLLILVGSRQVLRAMIENDRKTLRYSCLAPLLQDDSIC